MVLPHPFLNRARRLRSVWWLVIFFVTLAALLLPLIFAAQAEGADVAVWPQAGVVFAASVICQLMRRRPLAELFGAFNWRWPVQLMIGGLIGATLMLAPALVLAACNCVEWRLSAQGVAALWPALMLFAGVAAAEELMFRGFFFQRLLDGLGEWPAQIIVALFFTLTHSTALQSAGALGGLAAVNIFLASIMFGFAFLATRSLAMPLGMHLTANLVQGGILGFGVSGGDEPGVFAPILSGPDWLTGGAFGLEASVPGLICVTVTIGALFAWRRYALSGITSQPGSNA